MKKLMTILAVSVVLTGCGETLIASRATPDELRVIDAAPLTLPPDYELRPPRPGEKGKLTVRTHTNQAKELILKTEQTQSTQNASTADWLVKKAGGEDRDSDIRLKLDVAAEVEEVEEKEKGFFEKMFGTEEPTESEPQS